MRLNFRHIGLSLLVAGGMVLAGCGDDTGSGGDTGGGDGSTLKDTGTPGDGGGGDAATDGGVRDTGPRPDMGTPDTGVAPCADNTEGCECTPDPAGMDPQGSCETGLTCVTWDGGPPVVASCVRTCNSDAECAASTVGNTVCGEVGLAEQACVSAVVGDDELCVGSNLNGGPMAGCEADLDCLIIFSDLESYEGLCLELCEPTMADPTGGCTDPFPYCRPDVFSGTSSTGEMLSFGHCAVRQNLAGGSCAGGGLTDRCDTSSGTGNLACIGNPVSEENRGFCMEFCDNENPDCQQTDPNLGQSYCTPIAEAVLATPCTDDAACIADGWERCDLTRTPAVCVLNDGVCNFDCSNFPSSCGNPGAHGLGQTCVDNLVFDMNFQLSFCVDRQPPPLIETLWEYDVAADTPGIRQAGDNCLTTQGDGLRCPEFTLCLDLDGTGATGACTRGCNSSTVAMGQPPRGGCETMTSSSSQCIGGFLGGPEFGICMEPF